MKYSIVLLLLLSVTTSYAAPDGYILIPKLGLYKSVVFIPDSDPSTTYYYDLTELRYGVGYLELTHQSRIVLVGHTPGAFEQVHTLSIGDEIILNLYDEYVSYTIYDMFITSKEDGAVIRTVPKEFDIVLITCTEDETKRLIVKAK